MRHSSSADSRPATSRRCAAELRCLKCSATAAHCARRRRAAVGGAVRRRRHQSSGAAVEGAGAAAATHAACSELLLRSGAAGWRAGSGQLLPAEDSCGGAAGQGAARAARPGAHHRGLRVSTQVSDARSVIAGAGESAAHCGGGYYQRSSASFARGVGWKLARYLRNAQEKLERTREGARTAHSAGHCRPEAGRRVSVVHLLRARPPTLHCWLLRLPMQPLELLQVF